MKLPSAKTIGYGLIAIAASICVGLILNAYFGPGRNPEHDIYWLKRAIGRAAFGGALVVRSQAKSTVVDDQRAVVSQEQEGQSTDEPGLN